MTLSKTRRILFAVVLSMIVSACEETIDITDAAYTERMVVYGMLQPGQPVVVSITRTLPINEPYSAAKAALIDVSATITVDDPASGAAIETVTLVHSGNGYYTAPSLNVQSGLRYRFHAAWHGKSVHASTVVPHLAQIDTLDLAEVIREYYDFTDTSLYMRAVVRARRGEVYLLTTGDVDPRTGKSIINGTYGDAQIGRMRDATPSGHVILFERGYRMSTPDVGYVVSYDEPYYDFQQTYYSRIDDGPFGSGADNVRWTIEGDGIGLFVGRTIIERRL